MLKFYGPFVALASVLTLLLLVSGSVGSSFATVSGASNESLVRTYAEDSGNDFTIIYRTEGRYKSVVKMHYTASFIVDHDSIDDNTLSRSVRNNISEQALVVKLTESFFFDHGSMARKAEALKRNFEDVTDMTLMYVIVDNLVIPNLQECIDSFERLGVAFLNNYTSAQWARPAHVPTEFHGIIVVDYDNLSVDVRNQLEKNLRRAKKEDRLSPMSLSDYMENHSALRRIPRESSHGTSTSNGRATVLDRSAAPTTNPGVINATAAPAPLVQQSSNSSSQRYATLSSSTSGNYGYEPLVTRNAASRPEVQYVSNPHPNTNTRFATLPSSLATGSSGGKNTATTATVIEAPADSISSSTSGTPCHPGTFSLLIKGGLEHYEAIKVFDRNSALIVTTGDLRDRAPQVRRVLQDRRKLVVSLSAEELADRSQATAAYQLITRFQPRFFEHFMIPDGVSKNIRSIFTSPTSAEIRPSSHFTAAESNLERSHEPFNFSNIVLVDLEETVRSGESPAKLLQTLETKMERQDRSPHSLQESIIGLGGAGRSRSVAVPTELEKVNRFRNELAASVPAGYHALNLYPSRANVFTNAFEQFRLTSDANLKNARFRVEFEGEEGSDAGGLTREWFSLVVREIFNPNYVLFRSSESNQDVFHPNPNSDANYEHLDYFRFIGRFIGKAIIDGTPIQCNFSRAIYKLILGRSLSLFDLEELDAELHRSLTWIASNSVTGVMDDSTFTVGDNEFGVHREIELKPNGANINLSEENKFEYISLMIQYKCYIACRAQIDAFLAGLRQMVPANLLSSFTVGELKRIISGSADINVDDWEANTIYSGRLQKTDQVIRWFWEAVRSFTQKERRQLLLFSTGSPSVPLEGFGFLRSNGIVSRFKITSSMGGPNSLPEGHTCFNRIDLPNYRSYRDLREKVLIAITDGNGAYLMR